MTRTRLTAAEAAEERDRFETWLSHMDDYLDDLRASLPPATAAKLDYSLESLEVIEALVLAEFPDVDTCRRPESAQRLNLFAVYVGETLRKQAGGTWDIPLDDPDSIYFKVPVIRGMGPSGNKVKPPLPLVTASTSRRTGNYIRMVAENQTRSTSDGT